MRWTLAAALLAAAPAAAVDVFSPGDLAKPHASVEGLASCTKCHPAGEQLSRERCVACHQEIGARLQRGAGYHGKLPERERDCWRCHHDHLGREFPLVDWGEKGRDGFDHDRVGWPLTGKHRPVRCEKCHDAKYVKEPPLLEALRKGRKTTYLGAPAACDATCHKDPHENRLGPACDACHTAEDWHALTPKAREDQTLHDKTRYPLRGAHAKVPCKACHGPAPGEAARWRGMPFAACGDCHADAHAGQLADPRCDRCHGLEGFLPARYGPEEHEKARYRLEGAHLAVACARCHPKDPRVAARFPPGQAEALARYGRKPRVSEALYAVAGDLARCEACHADAHGGQLASPLAGTPASGGRGLAAKACAACHELASFAKLRFDHAKDSRYPLDGKHAQARCNSCHRPDARGVVRWRPLPLACEGCHADPHAGTLADAKDGAARCERCHGTTTWKELRFAHERPFTDYRLEAKHAKVACGKCHPTAEVARAVRTARWRGVPRACAACHEDPHKGALREFAEAALVAGRGKTGSGGREGPSPKAEGTEWPPGGSVRAQGQPDEAAPERAGGSGGREGPSPKAEGTEWPPGGSVRAQGQPDEAAPERAGGSGGREGPSPKAEGTEWPPVTKCEACHGLEGWEPKPFAHERTGFTLVGVHLRTPCRACHGEDLARPQPRGCVGCHRDPHQGRLGGRCRQCHDEALGWRAAFDANAHRRTDFPLEGRHALLPCEECHGDRLSPGFSRPTPVCLSCHEADRARTAALGPELDHVAGGFSTRCQECHSPWRFQAAFLPQHEACFGIASGNHAGIRCAACHDAAVEPLGTTDWSCSPKTSHCERCHDEDEVGLRGAPGGLR